MGLWLNGANLGILKLARNDLNCALEGLDEKVVKGFGGKMNFYLEGMINAQE